MSSVDTVLRGVAAVTAVAALLTVAANPQLHVNYGSDAGGALAQDSLQRVANAHAKGYTFLLHSDESRYPGRWCRGTIPYTLDLSQAQAAGLDPGAEAARWATVLQKWSDASAGYYRFVYAGPRTLGTKPDGQLDLDSIESGTIGITFVNDQAETAGTDTSHTAAAVRGRTAGNGGLQVTSVGTLPGGSLVGDKGFVMIDAEDAAALAPDGMRQALYQHESGHALGLGHVQSDTSIMNGTLSEERLTLARGDLAGIRALTELPCQN